MVFSEEGEAGLAGLNGIQEVTGSIPVISTKTKDRCFCYAFLAEKTRTPPRKSLWWCFSVGGRSPKAPS